LIYQRRNEIEVFRKVRVPGELRADEKESCYDTILDKGKCRLAVELSEFAFRSQCNGVAT
jgi:hypothetical protein